MSWGLNAPQIRPEPICHSTSRENINTENTIIKRNTNKMKKYHDAARETSKLGLSIWLFFPWDVVQTIDDEDGSNTARSKTNTCFLNWQADLHEPDYSYGEMLGAYFERLPHVAFRQRFPSLRGQEVAITLDVFNFGNSS